ncbi:hypothetical protein P0O24_01105 [Methanotrichaceae archaeon M04Ac]|uniref:Secreted protein n=1 Tax=Candidatus Methanocrinis alkalitolerans TaxID=3033395 RepID=A0ABT5XBU5_9EURY|nr:hypothetical protein [Candidatus Methanocrinis alkalitolerans]MDF0592185.1 hypothetical protein [Candidatus Methanocrinis alkalitolerans]
MLWSWWSWLTVTASALKGLDVVVVVVVVADGDGVGPDPREGVADGLVEGVCYYDLPRTVLDPEAGVAQPSYLQNDHRR